MNPSISAVGRLFHLPAFVRVELNLEAASTLMVPPAGVHSLVFIVPPCVLSYAQLNAVILQNHTCLVHDSNIVVTIGNKCVMNTIIYLVHKFLARLSPVLPNHSS